MNINSVTKGQLKTVLVAVDATTTSSAVDLQDYDGVLLDITITGTGTWAITITGATTADGAYKPIYDTAGDEVSGTGSITASRIQAFTTYCPFIKVTATESDGTATCNVAVMPLL